MPNTYEVSISLDNETIQQLYAGGYSLQIFKGAKSSQNNALIALWTTVKEFANTIMLNWSVPYGIFYGEQTTIKNGVIEVYNTQAAPLGSVITILQDGTANVVPGAGDSFTIQNELSGFSEYSCGLIQSINSGKPVPTCIISSPIAANNVIGPLETLVLTFSKANTQAGTIVEQTTTPSVTIMLSNKVNAVSLGFDINDGWSNNNNSPNITINPLDIILAQSLIVPVN
ncbi:MAG TPA: hypothetical protein VHB54_10050 [Mucilaginibacter sp.]|nr:hypothetical protein [Mucilaginibacter sp.]